MQSEVKRFLRDPERGRLRPQATGNPPPGGSDEHGSDITSAWENGDLLDRRTGGDLVDPPVDGAGGHTVQDRMVDVVLSDMSAPWDQISGFWKRTLSDPYNRLMHVSGTFSDHAGSMVCTRSCLVAAFSVCLGSLRCGPTVLQRYTTYRRSLCVQILSGRRGQGP